jgi:hypothetical protein
MGVDKFYRYSGRVETLPCSIRQFVFSNINKDQAYQVTCGSNEGYNEVWWYYCSQNSTVVDTYVIYNYLDNVWYYGALERTAWLDSGIRQNPMGAYVTNIPAVQSNTPFVNPVSRILYHEVGTDDASGLTPVPIVSYVQSSDFDLGDGQQFSSVWRILPDVNFNGSNVNDPYVTMTLLPRQNAGTAYGNATTTTTTSADDYSKYPEYTIQQFTGQVYTRLRGRQLSMVIGSDELGVAWQLGTPRIDIKPDGRR